jgi:ABC-type glycerol-3-phosphate transport system substrate-binding protein
MIRRLIVLAALLAAIALSACGGDEEPTTAGVTGVTGVTGATGATGAESAEISAIQAYCDEAVRFYEEGGKPPPGDLLREFIDAVDRLVKQGDEAQLEHAKDILEEGECAPDEARQVERALSE